jgi:hypothetical protein
VKGIVCIEGAFLWSMPFQRPSGHAELYAFSARPMTFDPPVESFLRGVADGVLANMRQLGMNVDDLCLWKHGIRGNGHVPMVEKNSSEVATFVMDWLARQVES